MLRVDVYPVLDGLEVWVAARCPGSEPGHDEHSGHGAATFIERERLDKLGLEAVIGFELAAILTEFPEVAARTFC